MRYTLEQACERLASYQHAYGVTDVKTAINSAIQALAGLSGWECLRKVVRFSSAGPAFALPQGCAGLVRACVNGKPVTMRGQDFRFLLSGPGDEFNRPSRGYSLVPPGNIESDGFSPIIFKPRGPFRLFAYSDGTGEPSLTVRGVDRSGRQVQAVLPMNAFPAYDNLGALVSGMAPEDVVPDSTEFLEITEVVLDKCATQYVTLYARETSSDVITKIAIYHPSVRVPLFRHYRIAGYPEGRPLEILAEVRIDPLPLVNDTDVLPFDGIEPIEYMILYAWKMQSSEVDAARKFKEEAATWLRAHEVADNTVQTSLTFNCVTTGSMGEVSRESANI